MGRDLIEESLHPGQFIALRFAAPGELRRQPEARRAVARRGKNPLAEGGAGPVDEGGVHEEQALRRRDRGVADGDALIGIGRVEERQERMPPVALHHEIDAPTIGVVLVVLPVERLMDRERPGVDGREGVGGWRRAIEQAACREKGVAERLGIE